MLLAFILWELHTPDPMLDVSFFKNPRFSAASVAVTSCSSRCSVDLLPEPVHPVRARLQPARRRTAGAAAGAGPGRDRRRRRALGQAGRRPAAGHRRPAAGHRGPGLLRHRHGRRRLPALHARDGHGLGRHRPGHVPPRTTLTMEQLPPALAGVGSAVNDATRNLGSVLGVAVVGSITASVAAGRLAVLGSTGHPHAFASAFIAGSDYGVLDPRRRLTTATAGIALAALRGPKSPAASSRPAPEPSRAGPGPVADDPPPAVPAIPSPTGVAGAAAFARSEQRRPRRCWHTCRMTRRTARSDGGAEPSAMLRSQHAEATRRAVLDAAKSLFGRQGYAQTSVDEIADAARVTKGAVYHHFTGKEALSAPCTRRWRPRAGPRAERGTAGMAPVDQMVAMMNAYLDAALDSRSGGSRSSTGRSSSARRSTRRRAAAGIHGEAGVPRHGHGERRGHGPRPRHARRTCSAAWRGWPPDHRAPATPT